MANFLVDAGRQWLLKVLLFSIFGLLFLQKPRMQVITLLVLLLMVVVLACTDTRQVLNRVIRGNQYPNLRWIAWPFLIWFLAEVIVMACAPQSFTGADLELLDKPLRFVVALCLIALCVVSPASPRYLLWGLLGAAITAVVHGAFGVAAGGTEHMFSTNVRVEGWMTSPIHFGNWSVLTSALLVLVSALSVSMPTRLRIGLLVFAALALSAGAFSGSRSPLLVLPVLGCLLLVLRKDRFHRWLVGAGVVGCVVSVALIFSNPGVRQQLRLTEAMQDFEQVQVGNYDTSLGARLVMWQVAWRMFQAHPWLGSGPRGFSSAMTDAVENGQLPRIPNFTHAHSDVMQVFATGGLVRGVAFLGLLIGPAVFFLRALRQPNADARARVYAASGLLVVGAFFVFGLTSFNLHRHIYSTTYPLIVCALVGQLLVQRR